MENNATVDPQSLSNTTDVNGHVINSLTFIHYKCSL